MVVVILFLSEGKGWGEKDINGQPDPSGGIARASGWTGVGQGFAQILNDMESLQQHIQTPNDYQRANSYEHRFYW